jgi:hypothetical protein
MDQPPRMCTLSSINFTLLLIVIALTVSSTLITYKTHAVSNDAWDRACSLEVRIDDLETSRSAATGANHEPTDQETTVSDSRVILPKPVAKRNKRPKESCF